MAIDKKELWINWTRDAVGRYVVPDEVGDADELVDDMSDVAIKFADTMLDEFEERFDADLERPVRKRQRRRKPAQTETETE